MASEQYCLRWNDHRTILLTNFERLLQNNCSVDCTLAAEGQCLRAHKVVLSACSPYFELMLNQDKEKHPIIFMKDMKFKELQAIIEYMYRGEVVIPHGQLATLLQAAESLQIKGLGCGEKTQTPMGGRGLNQQQQPQKQMQQPQPQQLPLQQLAQKREVQPTRVPAPTSRGPGPDVTQTIIEPAPQLVDLTDDRVPVNAAAASAAAALGAHHAQENAKRSLPQNASRAKKVAHPVANPERYTQNNVLPNLGQTTVQAIYPPQNFIMTNATQAGGTNMIAAIAPVASVVTLPPKQVSAVSRPPNESGGHSAVQVLTPPAPRPEAHDGRDSDNQPAALRPKARAMAVQKRFAQGRVTPPVKNGGAGVAPSQNTTSTGVTKVSAPTTAANTLASVLPEVRLTNSATEQLQVNDSESLDSLQESVVDKAGEPEAEQPSLEELLLKETSTKKSPALDKPGPSGLGKKTPGRRGRGQASEKRYQCPECDKRFTQKSYLENHLRIHDGECYECDNCTKNFLSRATLLKHLRTHAAKATANPPHKCQLCGATFPSAADLEKHLTDHTLSGTDNE